MVYLSHDWNNILIFVIASLALVILFLSLFFLFQDGFASLKLFNLKNLLLKIKTKEKRININFHGNLAQLSGYECGFDVFSDARSPFDVHFYLVSILFIIFNFLSWSTFDIVLFFLLLTLGFIYIHMYNYLNSTHVDRISFINCNIIKKNDITWNFVCYIFLSFISFLMPFLLIFVLIYFFKNIKTKIIIFYNYVFFVKKKLNIKILNNNDLIYYTIIILVLSVLIIIFRKISIGIGGLFFGCIIFVLIVLRLIFSLFLIGLDKIDLNSNDVNAFEKELKKELPQLKIQILVLEGYIKKIPFKNFWNFTMYVILTWKLYWLKKTIIFTDFIVYKKSVYYYLDRVLKIKFLVTVLTNIIAIIFMLYVLSPEAQSIGFMYLAIPIPQIHKNGFIINGPTPLESLKDAVEKLITDQPDPKPDEHAQKLITNQPDPKPDERVQKLIDNSPEAKKAIEKLIDDLPAAKEADKNLKEALVKPKPTLKDVVEKKPTVADAVDNNGVVLYHADTELNKIKTLLGSFFDSNIPTAEESVDASEAVNASNKPVIPGEKIKGYELNIIFNQITPNNTPLVDSSKVEIVKGYHGSRTLLVNGEKIAEIFELEVKSISISDASTKKPLIEPENTFFLPINKELYPNHFALYEAIEKNRQNGLSVYTTREISQADINAISQLEKTLIARNTLENSALYRAVEASSKGGSFFLCFAKEMAQKHPTMLVNYRGSFVLLVISAAGLYIIWDADIAAGAKYWPDYLRALFWSKNPTMLSNPFESADPVWERYKADQAFSHLRILGEGKLSGMQMEAENAAKIADWAIKTMHDNKK